MCIRDRSNLLRAAGRGRQSMWVLLVGTATVAVLDPLVIFVFDGGMRLSLIHI